MKLWTLALTASLYHQASIAALENSACNDIILQNLSRELNPVRSKADWFSSPDIDGAAVIRVFSSSPEIARLYAADSGLLERLSIQTHTQRVFSEYEELVSQGALSSIKMPKGFRTEALLKATIALHDIGKPLAVKVGNKDLQHQFTLPIVRKELEKAGFSENEIKVAEGLVSSDFMGLLIQSKYTPDEAFVHLLNAAAKAGISPREFLKLKTIYYTADAGSYEFLEKSVFHTVDGIQRPKSPLLIRLEEMVRDL